MDFGKLQKLLQPCDLNSIEFLILKVTSTNASRSVPFTNACCVYEFIKDDDHDLFHSVKFTTLFDKGIRLIRKFTTAAVEELKNLNDNEKAALEILDSFFKMKDEAEKCLQNVLRTGMGLSNSPFTKTDLTIVLAEHLLGKLSPGGSYVINAKAENKGECKCGCAVYPVFGNTGIGHEEVWHGHLDIVLSTHKRIPTEDLGHSDGVPVYCMRDKMEDTDSENEDFSPEDLTFMEGNSPTTSTARDKAIEQTLAQTIVSSLLCMQCHPNSEHHLVPGILIDKSGVQITMYDAENDILLCSNVIPLFLPPDYHCFNSRAVIILWLVLHHRLFCSGMKAIDENTLFLWKSNFRRFVDSKWEIYSKCLKDSVSDFPVAQSVFDWKEAAMYAQSYLPR